MNNWRIGFEYPEFLLLLVCLPIIYWIGRRSLAGLGFWRQTLAILFRSAVLLLIIAAIAGVQWISISDRLCVIYLLDQSDSIPVAKRQLMLRYAIENASRHRRSEFKRQDRVGLILFGREASIEFPPLDENLPPIKQAESDFGTTDATNLEAALKLAQACFPEDAARRIVVLTDGNETLGSAATVGKGLVESGIGIDVIPIRLDSGSEVLVEKIDIPSQIRQGQPVEARVVLQRFSNTESAEAVRGKLRVVRRIGNESEVLAEDEIELDRETTVVPILHRVDQAAGYTYEAEFVPENTTVDSISQNNRVTAFAYARGKGRVMLIENSDRVGEYKPLVEALRREGIEVDTRDTSNLFSSLIELQSYDSIILAGVSRSVGEDAAGFNTFSDSQIEVLTQSVQQFGIGLLMLGGPEAFGAGGWSNTKLEEAMPVDFQIKNSKVQSVGALALVLDKSGSMNGEKIRLAKVAARAAVDALGPLDYIGLYAFDSGLSTITPLGKATDLRRVVRTRIGSLAANGGTDMWPAIERAYRDLEASPAAIKHVIALTDGMTSGDGYSKKASAMHAKGITTSTVCIGTDSNQQLLQDMAVQGGGNFYAVSNIKVLPQIFMREARRVTRPLVFEPEGGIQPALAFEHDALPGIPSSIPSLKGFVLTQVKENALVEVPLLSPSPAEAANASLLATWTYGLGRTAVFTSDVGQRWASDWLSWPQYDQFFTQIVRWTMRSTIDDGKYQLATQIRDGKVQVIVTAMDEENRLVDFMNMSGTTLSPDMKPLSFLLKQKAPGRYVGEFDISTSGAYTLSVIPGAGKAQLISGVSVPFSDEYRVRQTNRRLLEELATIRPVGGTSGKLLEPLETSNFLSLTDYDPFRSDLPKARSLQDVWPLAILIASALFFADVFVRRVSLDFVGATGWLKQRIWKSSAERDRVRQDMLERLKNRKAEVADALDTPNEAPRVFASNASPNKDSSAQDSFSTGDRSPPKPPERSQSAQSMLEDPTDRTSYTERLLEAKRRAKKGDSRID